MNWFLMYYNYNWYIFVKWSRKRRLPKSSLSSSNLMPNSITMNATITKSGSNLSMMKISSSNTLIPTSEKKEIPRRSRMNRFLRRLLKLKKLSNSSVSNKRAWRRHQQSLFWIPTQLFSWVLLIINTVSLEKWSNKFQGQNHLCSMKWDCQPLLKMSLFNHLIWKEWLPLAWGSTQSREESLKSWLCTFESILQYKICYSMLHR